MMTSPELRWSWQDRDVVVGIDEVGSGPLVVLLPAPSSISTRAEMRPLMDRLASQFRVISFDWPGFGTRARPGLSWTPAALSAFLEHALHVLGERPRGVVAAGHAATYLLHHAALHPDLAERLVLIAPTWRGPLPTMAGGSRPLFDNIRRLIEVPGLGAVLYRLNVSSFVVRMMVAGHVYSDAGWLSGPRLAIKRQVMDAPGARFASAAFVTGALDRVASRAEFLRLAESIDIPILLVYGGETPPRSRAEMEALAQLPRLRTARLARGKLSVHEEFPDEVAAAVQPFLLT
jgi:pimeloyl-ACP methyl ester carboxylesterase